jgi:hypothetical protein
MKATKKHKKYTTLLFMFLCILCLFVANTAAEVEKSEMRCGWFSNPTPSNASLHDRDAEWIIGVQGGYQAEGDWPEFAPKQWIETNVHYGYGCACMKVRVDGETHRVIEIESAKARPLSACRSDRKLKHWGFK